MPFKAESRTKLHIETIVSTAGAQSPTSNKSLAASWEKAVAVAGGFRGIRYWHSRSKRVGNQHKSGNGGETGFVGLGGKRHSCLSRWFVADLEGDTEVCIRYIRGRQGLILDQQLRVFLKSFSLWPSHL